mgnify:CR=1 FL=1
MSSMISAVAHGDFKDTTSFLEFLKSYKMYKDLDRYGRIGADALASATPRDTGLTAQSWNYTVGQSGDVFYIWWTNSHVEHGVNIAVLIQYGHGTGTGGYVPGYDYINPALRPVLDRIVDDVWRQVTNA